MKEIIVNIYTGEEAMLEKIRNDKDIPSDIASDVLQKWNDTNDSDIIIEFMQEYGFPFERVNVHEINAFDLDAGLYYVNRGDWSITEYY